MTEQTSDAVGDSANATLDNRMWVNWVRFGHRRIGHGFTYRQFRQELKNRKSVDLSETSIWRLATNPLNQILGPRSKFNDIAGLGELAIEKLFPRSQAGKVMRIEWLLRSANYNLLPSAEATLLLPEAEGLLEAMDEAAAISELSSIDLLARASLGGQIPTYKAGAKNIDPTRKVRLFREAQRRLAEYADQRMYILQNVESAFTHIVLAVRMESLAYFAEYNLQNEAKSDLPAMSRRLSQDWVLRAVARVTKELGDPRIPINFAEAAGSVALIEGGGKAESYNKKAKAMIELILETAGYTDLISDFSPVWLKDYRLSDAKELEAAIGFIEGRKE
jgi:hypothetical protein